MYDAIAAHNLIEPRTSDSWIADDGGRPSRQPSGGIRAPREDNNFVTAIAQSGDDVPANEPRTASNENAHFVRFPGSNNLELASAEYGKCNRFRADGEYLRITRQLLGAAARLNR